MKRITVLLIALVLVPTGRAQATHAPNDTYYSSQWGIKRIRAHAAWHVTEGAGAVVAVLDTGVTAVPDLGTNVLSGYDAVDPGTPPTDGETHGTLVAGVIAAKKNNNLGIAGVAPKAKILPVRVLGPRGGTSAQVTNGILWAADNGADVINMSLGTEVFPVTNLINPGNALEQAAIAYALAKGVVVVSAAGNARNPVCGTPALLAGSLCVGALDQFGGLADFGKSGGSNYGVGLDIVAPGQSIVSTTSYGSFGSASGTSLAAPFASGVAAQLVAMGATNVQVEAILRLTAEDRGLPGYDHTYGWGVLDAEAAVELCAQICA